MPRKTRRHNTIPTTAYMHEGTVQDIADGTIQPMKKERAKPTAGFKVGHIKIDPRVWKTALRIANGNAHRIEIYNAQSVTVHNNITWRKSA